MAVQLDKVVPFGRSRMEYELMFHLSPQDMEREILDIAGGPASFNAEMSHLGYTVTSIDPIYQFTGQEIQKRFDACVDNIIEQVRATPDDWIWNYHKSPDDLRRNREKAIAFFLADYEKGKAEHRYLVGSLPDLPTHRKYDLVLCSHFLFLYSKQLSYDFHQQAILKLLEYSNELRIFPLLTLDLQRSPYLDLILEELHQRGYRAEITKVDFEFQLGGNEMLKILVPWQKQE
jgi:hypothetical protein